jgi:hypothetical protein
MSSGVEFDEDKISYGVKPRYSGVPQAGGFSYGQAEQPGMAGWLMRKGIAKTPGAAQGILIVLVIINIVITYFVITYFL